MKKETLYYRYFVTLMIVVLSGCNHLFYYPDQNIYLDLDGSDIHYQDHFYQVDQWSLHARYFPARKKVPCQNTLLVHFHGNAQNLSSHFTQLYWVTNYGVDYLVFDYPGYGKSSGKANDGDVQRSSLLFIEKLLSENDSLSEKKNIVLYGQSLGGAILQKVLSQIKSTERIHSVFIEASFNSYQSMAREKMSQSWLTWPLQWLAYPLVSDKQSANKQLMSKQMPKVTVLHGDADHLVPISQGKDLYKKLPQPKEFIEVKGARHLNILKPSFKIREKIVSQICQAS